MDGFDARYRRIQEGDLREATKLLRELPEDSVLAGRVSLLRSLGIDQPGCQNPETKNAEMDQPGCQNPETKNSETAGKDQPNVGMDQPGCQSATGSADVATLALLARRALIRLERADLAKYVEALGATGGREHKLWRGFQEALFGDNGEAAQRGGEIHRAARSAGDATMAIDAMTLEAVSAMVAGRFDDALATARKAARMAQTEHLWLPHYFASLFLARLRRLTGTCHAAVRIIDSALITMPPLWHGWLHWERLCAGEAAQSLPGDSPVAKAAMTLARWLRSDTSFDKPEAFVPNVTTSVIHRRDIAAAEALFSDGVPPAPYEAWLFGADPHLPRHMHGFVTLGVQGEGGGALVLSAPGRRARRIAQVALPVGIPDLGESPKQRTRVNMLLSTLCLAGDKGIGREELFEQTYGFPYNEAAHDAAFRVLRHHASNHLGDHGELTHEDRRHFVHIRAPFAVADPRTVRPFKDMMLQMLARHGGQSARVVATDLGVPLRTVQAALKEMVGDGMCSTERSGNRVTYEVEDTTFAPLTVG